MKDVFIASCKTVLLLSMLFVVLVAGPAAGGEKYLSPYLSVTEQGDGYIVMEWFLDANASEEELSGFRIYRETAGNGSSVVEMLGSLARSYNDTGVENGESYDYRVAALYTEDLVERISDVASGKPGTVPGPPKNLTAERSRERVVLRWNPPSYDGGYPLERVIIQRLEGSTSFQVIGTLKGDGTEFSDTSTEDRMEYSYRVIITNSMGPSEPSPAVSVFPVLTRPDAPFGLRAESGEDFMVIAWNPPKDDGGSPLTGFVVRRISGKSGTTEEFEVPSSMNRFNDTGLEQGVNYTYYVHAVNDRGRSPPSDPLTAALFEDYTGLPGEVADDDDGRINWPLYGAIGAGVLLIIIAVMIYLRMTDSLDEEGETDAVSDPRRYP